MIAGVSCFAGLGSMAGSSGKNPYFVVEGGRGTVGHILERGYGTASPFLEWGV